MKIFLAGAGHSQINIRFKDFGASKLVSYYLILERKNMESRHKFLRQQGAFLGKNNSFSSNPHCYLMMDSGAYSAWTRDLPIDIEEYAEFVQEHNDIIDYVINLDVIPGRPGRPSSKAEIDECAQKGWENLAVLEGRGVKAVHVFHQGEDICWLEKLIDSYDYFGISPAEDRGTEEKAEWLDSIMEYLVDSDGMPIRKFHGFGVTAVDLLYKYPWYSADSTTWMLLAAYGKVIVPKVDPSTGKFDLIKPPSHIVFTSRTRKEKPGLTYSHLSDLDRVKVDEWLNSLEDIDISKLGEDEGGLVERCKVNVQYFVMLEQRPILPWKKVRDGFV